MGHRSSSRDTLRRFERQDTKHLHRWALVSLRGANSKIKNQGNLCLGLAFIREVARSATNRTEPMARRSRIIFPQDLMPFFGRELEARPLGSQAAACF